MSLIKKASEIELLRESGKRLAKALDTVEKAVRPGISTLELDRIAEEAIRARGDSPAFLNYRPEGANKPYAHTLCISVNDEVVHGIPRKNKILKDGDIVGLDLGLAHEGLITDSARTVPVGEVSEKAQKLLEVTKGALEAGIAAARAGNYSGDIGVAIEKMATLHGFSVIRELGGHGVGNKVHEDPFIPNFGKKAGQGTRLEAGMVLAIEPMINLGNRFVSLAKDGYTIRTTDGSPSAHFEHTILVTDGEAEILTQL